MTDEDNPIIAEVRRIREELLARFNGDIRALGRYATEQAIKEGRTLVSFPPYRVSPAEQEAARIRLQKLLEEEAKSSGAIPKPESSDSRLAG
jgi:hypothetical protein